MIILPVRPKKTALCRSPTSSPKPRFRKKNTPSACSSSLEGGDVEITAAFPAGIITGTEANLYAAAAGEHHEYTEMYPSFANIADSEGFSEVACVMRNIAIAEQYHEERFLAFAKNIKEGRVFVRETPVVWRCRNCGCLVTGTHAPALCPACAHPTAHFEVLHNPW